MSRHRLGICTLRDIADINTKFSLFNLMKLIFNVNKYILIDINKNIIKRRK